MTSRQSRRLPSLGGLMSAPNKVSKPGGSVPPPAAVEAPDLRIEALLVDPSNKEDPQQYVKKWKDVGYRVQNRKMDYAVEMAQRFLAGDAKVDEAKVLKAIEDWKASPEFGTDPANKVVLANLLGQLAKGKDTAQGKVVLGALPGGAEILNPPKPEEKKEKEDSKDSYDMKKYWNVGLSLRQDTGLLFILDKMGVPISAFASDQNHFNARASLDFPMGDHVGMVRLQGGTFVLRGVPGSAVDPTKKPDYGTGYRVGVDFGLVDPASKSHFTTGMGLELTGLASFAGQEQGIKGPGPTPRLHFFRQSEIPITFGNFQLGLGSFFNQQETYFPLGNGEPLLDGTKNTPVSYASSLYARNSLPLLVLSGRFYWNGVPDFPDTDLNTPFMPGEATTKVVSLLPSKIIMFNRSRDVAAFATDQVFMALEPLGPKGSRDQFDTLSLGLWAYSIQDGLLIAGNADTTAEIFLRPNTSWAHKGTALGMQGAGFLWHVIGAATRKGDPVYGNIAEFQKNPGSVTDFDGRGYNMAWKLDLWEGALTAGTYGLEKGTSKKGEALTGDEEHDKAVKRDQWIYRGVGIGASVLGVVGNLLAGAISGQGCGGDANLLGCTFSGTREKFFAPGQDFSPSTMTGIENNYVVSALFSSLLAWGAPKMFYSAPTPKQSPGGNAVPEAPKPAVTGRLEVTPNKVFVGVSGTF